jgi:hypothetical protein
MNSNRRTRFLVLLAAAGVVVVQLFHATDCRAGPDLQKRWLYISSNLYLDENLPKITGLLDRAAKAGYNGVLFSDANMLTWWKLEEPGRWRSNAAALRRKTAELGLEVIFCVFPFGYSTPILFNDVNLAAGMPIRDAPLERKGDVLVPVRTASIGNGSFEEYRGDRAPGYMLQDGPGTGSFIDTKVFKEGGASLRFENVGAANEHGHGRVFQRIAVEPWRQYRIRVWMRAEHLTADRVQIIVLAGRRPILTGNLWRPLAFVGSRPLQYQYLVVPSGEGCRYTQGAKDLTIDWIEQSVIFNSLDNTRVTIGAGVWGGKSGTIWWDDLRIEDEPTLNVLRRASVPLTIVGEDGMACREGSDFDPVADPKLGRCGGLGLYDTRHEPPRITVPALSRIKEGERVYLSCYHAAIVYDGQVSCSLSDPEVFALCAEQLKRTEEALSPDGYMMSHDEIRCAGWEPAERTNFRTTGEVLADNVRRCCDIASREARGKPLYVWSDMFDPNHNAHADYCLVNNTIAGSWKGLPSEVTVVKWGDRVDAAAGLRFFAGRGNALMIAAFYDGDVEKDYINWRTFAEGVPGIVGVVYTTWRDDYSNLERFAETWWGRKP